MTGERAAWVWRAAEVVSLAWFGVVFLLIASPLFAELISSYLSGTGDVVASLGVIAFLAPLYGGVSLAIREVSVRRRLGWRARILLASAFAVAMPTLVDGSLFMSVNPDVSYWDDLMRAARIGNIGVYAALGWVVGHVVLSISAPIALAEGLVGSTDVPWTSIRVVAIIGLLGLGVGLLIRYDIETVRAGPLATAVSLAAAGILTVVAFLRARNQRPPRPHATLTQPVLVASIGWVLMLAVDLAPMNWIGVAVIAAAVVCLVVLVRCASDDPAWGPHPIATLAYGAVLARTMIGFAAPVPPGVDTAAKFAQNTTCLILVGLLGAALCRRITKPARPTPTSG